MAVSADNLESNKVARDMAVQLFKAGADVDIADSMGVNARIWLMDRNPNPDRPHAKKKELDELYEKSEEAGPSFWDSDEVKAFIEEGNNDFVKWANCGRWSDEIFQNGSMSKFQRCARCKNVYCKSRECIIDYMLLYDLATFDAIELDCSRECQKQNWKIHKKVCIAASNDDAK